MNKVFIIGIFVFTMISLACANKNEKNPSDMKAGKLEKASLAGGCFWCMELPFEKIEGVKEVISGYTGGQKPNPTYEEVSAGGTGHAEAIQVLYDPSKGHYADLFEEFS